MTYKGPVDIADCHIRNGSVRELAADLAADLAAQILILVQHRFEKWLPKKNIK